MKTETDDAPLTPAEEEDCAERAAIMEFDGNLPRDVAERLARQCVTNARASKESRNGPGR